MENDNKEKKFSGMSIAAKVIIIVLAIVLFFALVFYAIADGIVATITGFFDDLEKEVTELQKGIFKKDIVGSMDTYQIDDEQVENLKKSLENVGIDTDVSGLTEVRLRKILIAHGVSTSFSHTICVAPVTEEQIIANAKEKEYGKDFDDIGDFTKYCEDNGKDKESENIWPIENPNYKLYYDSSKFFYFQDTDLIMGGTDSDQWYLGAMGATEIKTENGTNVKYVGPTEFQRLYNEFREYANTHADNPDKVIGSDALKNLLSIYTDGDTQGTIKVYKIASSVKKYDYVFKKDGNVYDSAHDFEDDETEFDAKPVDISIEDKVDMSSYAISVELMVDLLDVTGSGEFLETFIDFALEKTGATVKAYSTTSTNYTYSVKNYGIKDDVILEIYDVIDFLNEDIRK